MDNMIIGGVRIYFPRPGEKLPIPSSDMRTFAIKGTTGVFADGWYEWKREGDKKQPYYIYRKDKKPLFFAAIGKQPFDVGDDAEGFLIVTAAADKGLVDIHDRRPLVFTPEAALEWINPETSGAQASELAHEAVIPADEFTWHPVTRAVGNVKNQGQELIEPISL